jgi:GTP-binding protein
VAVIGRPNVGKSSLVNKLLGEERLVASEVAGTTRDAIDTELEHEGQQYVFIDTAGLRRPRSVSDKLERIAVMSARRSLERCDVALILLDGTTRPSDQDARIAAMAHELGKGIVLVANKWDLIENPEWRDKYPEAVRHDLDFVEYAPFVRVSAKTGQGTHKLFAPIIKAQQERHRRIGTGELNRFFKEKVEHHPPPLFKGRRAQIYFVSQPLVRPPTFVFTAKNPSNIPEAYSRYLRNQIRERYGFEGSPIWLKFRPRGRPKAAGSKGTRLDS